MSVQHVLQSDRFRKCVDFHGHACPGLAIGFQAAEILMGRLGPSRAMDEELVAIVETDACSSDAIQVLTGCTFGKGNLVFKNYGKHAFSLMDRKKGGGIRVCLRPSAIDPGPEDLLLSEEMKKEEASPEEIGRFWQIQQERTRDILQADPASLFKIEEFSSELPPKARTVESGMCDLCGEPTKGDLLREMNGKKRCIPCREKEGV